MPDIVRVQVIFSEETPKGTFQDALYYTLAEYNVLKQSAIDTAKQERVNTWIAIVSNPIEDNGDKLQDG